MTVLTPPALIVEYRDPRDRFRGWFVRDRLVHSLSAGGLRVQAGLTREHLIEMARNMTRKMRITGIRVDGAKSGIDYDPAALDLEEALVTFLRAIRPYVETCYSLGPDLNVSMELLDDACLNAGIPSMKMAIAKAQGWDLPYFLDRYAILRQPLPGGWTLGKLRAGRGVAAAVLAVLDFLHIPHAEARIAVQGFGALARSAIEGVREAGGHIVAVSDDTRSLLGKNGGSIEGLDELLALNGTRLPATCTASINTAKRDAILRIPCDILVLAAVEHAVTVADTPIIMARAIVPGANLAVTLEAEKLLAGQGTIVLPDFLPGCGGSLSMDGLFGPAQHPTPLEVLSFVKERMTDLVRHVLSMSADDKITPRQAALALSAQFQDQPGTKPYGITSH